MTAKPPGLGQKSKKYKKPLFGTGQGKFKKRNVTKKRDKRKRDKPKTKKRIRVPRKLRTKRT